jgi:hypothetical protein
MWKADGIAHEARAVKTRSAEGAAFAQEPHDRLGERHEPDAAGTAMNAASRSGKAERLPQRRVPSPRAAVDMLGTGSGERDAEDAERELTTRSA